MLRFSRVDSVKPRVIMTSQSSAISPQTDVKTAQNSAKHYKKQVMRAVFALPVEATRPKALHPVPVRVSDKMR